MTLPKKVERTVTYDKLSIMTTRLSLPPSVSSVEDNRKRNLSRALFRPLDRVNVLGDSTSGHTGYGDHCISSSESGFHSPLRLDV